jgi:hypothetical protein
MPTISMFYGIVIRMYVGKKEHNPPHIYALYQDMKAIFDIKTGEKMEGNLPRDQSQLVSAALGANDVSVGDCGETFGKL